MVKAVPPSGQLTASMEPPSSSTSTRAAARATPVPAGLVVNPGLVRQSGARVGHFDLKGIGVPHARQHDFTARASGLNRVGHERSQHAANHGWVGVQQSVVDINKECWQRGAPLAALPNGIADEAFKDAPRFHPLTVRRPWGGEVADMVEGASDRFRFVCELPQLSLAVTPGRFRVGGVEMGGVEVGMKPLDSLAKPLDCGGDHRRQAAASDRSPQGDRADACLVDHRKNSLTELGGEGVVGTHA
jgi:hypothetical protein